MRSIAGPAAAGSLGILISGASDPGSFSGICKSGVRCLSAGLRDPGCVCVQATVCTASSFRGIRRRAGSRCNSSKALVCTSVGASGTAVLFRPDRVLEDVLSLLGVSADFAASVAPSGAMSKG